MEQVSNKRKPRKLKLTPDEQEHLKAMYFEGDRRVTTTYLARLFKVSQSTAIKVIDGKYGKP